MNNRKLMGALSILLLAILFMSVGCGDGKRQSHSNLRKVNPGKVGGNPKDIKQKAQQEANIRNRFEALIDKNSRIPLRDVPAGTYTLDEIAAHTNVTNPDNSVALTIAKVSTQGLSETSNDGVGMVVKISDEVRLITVPLTLTAAAGGSFAQSAAKDYRSYSCQVNQDGKIIHSLNAANGGKDNLLEKINASAQADNLIRGKVGGKTAEFTIHKTDTGFSILVTVYEKESFTKAMLFIYVNKNAQAQQQTTPAPAEAQPAAQTPPAKPGEQPAAPAASDKPFFAPNDIETGMPAS